MINKSLVKKRFSKSFSTYDKNALIQKEMAKKLIDLTLKEKKDFNKILEIGSATGILTKEIKMSFAYKKLYINDIASESKFYVDKIEPENTFIEGDIEEVIFNEKFDLIIANASLQWCNDIIGTLNKLKNLLTNNGILAVSMFGDKNLNEVKSIFNIVNNYKTEDIKKFVFFNNSQIFEEEIIKYKFETFIDILKHMKLTGINAIKEIKLTKNSLKKYEKEYITRYNCPILTYNPVYFIVKNF